MMTLKRENGIVERFVEVANNGKSFIIVEMRLGEIQFIRERHEPLTRDHEKMWAWYKIERCDKDLRNKYYNIKY